MSRIDPQEFRKAMGLFATGVTVVTTLDQKSVHGMTANAFTSVSLDPPLVLVSVDKRAETHSLIPACQSFGVNILRNDQEQLSRRYATKHDPVQDSQDLYDIVDGIPVMKDCLCAIACTLWRSYDGGDHTLYLGEVIHLRASQGEPLIFFSSKYCKIE
ncbi:MAG: flavin reductase family protein [Alicyclobacillus sp.]|nr:flavin reductase family protein [Alicyclobacillus sp.]